MYTHTYYIYMYIRMSSNNFYTNSSITLMYSLPYIYKHSRESHFPLVKRAFPNVIIKCNLSTASRREQRGGGGGGGAFDRFEAKIRSWHENLDPTLRKTFFFLRVSVRDGNFFPDIFHPSITHPRRKNRFTRTIDI